MSSYNPKPVAHCILNADMDKCEHIAYGVEDAPGESIFLYDMFVVQRLQRRIDALTRDNEHLCSQISAKGQPEVATQAIEASELPPNYTKHVAVKFMDGHVEHHQYSDVSQLDNATIIAQVKKMFPEKRVANVMVVEKG